LAIRVYAKNSGRISDPTFGTETRLDDQSSLYLNNFCIIYINNILVYSNIKQKYKNYIDKIFAKLYKASLYLDINKYIFFIKQIKYLNLIIIIKEI